MLAQMDLVPVLEHASRHFLSADEGAVQALEVFQDERRSGGVAVDAQVVARDAGIVQHDFVGLQSTNGQGR